MQEQGHPAFCFYTTILAPACFTTEYKIAKTMFGLFKKDPVKKLEKKYLKLMEEAMAIQRGGDIKAYAQKAAEAEEVAKEIEALKAKKEEG